jgi:hypothetical protein
MNFLLWKGQGLSDRKKSKIGQVSCRSSKYFWPNISTPDSSWKLSKSFFHILNAGTSKADVACKPVFGVLLEGIVKKTESFPKIFYTTPAYETPPDIHSSAAFVLPLPAAFCAGIPF